MAKGLPDKFYDTRSEENRTGLVTPRWWAQAEPHQALCAVADRIEGEQQGRRTRDLVHASLYANQPLDTLYQMGAAKTPSGWWDPLGLGHKLTWNVIQTVIDTAAAKISKNRPRIMYLTSGGDYSLQRRAKGLTKFTDGLFEAARAYEEGQRAFVDACVFDAGIVKVYTDGAEIKCERVLPAEILVDDVESIYGQPRSLYQRKYAHREVLIDAFGDRNAVAGEKFTITEGLKRTTGEDMANGFAASDMVPVYEGWHLGAGEPGRHVIATNQVTLFQDKYTDPGFPFAWFRWNTRLVGMWGQGLAETLVGIQLELTKLLRRIQEAIHLMAVPRIYYDGSIELEKLKYKNLVGQFVRHNGARAPEERVAQAMSSEVYQYVETLYAKAFEIARMSQLSAVGKKPEGLDAGVALREFHDIENEGFVVVAQRYERFYQDLAALMIHQARTTYGDGSKVVKAPGTKLLEEIAWKDVSLKEDQYVMRSFPVSLLPTTPAGRLQKIQEMLEAQLIDRDMAMSLMDFPDLEGAVNIHTSALEDAKKMVEDIVDKGRYETPEPEQNPRLIIKLAQSAYLKGRTDGVEPKRLELLQRLMAEAKEMEADLAPPAPAPGAAPAPMDPAAAVPGAMPPPAGPMGDPAMMSAPPEAAMMAPEPLPAI